MRSLPASAPALAFRFEFPAGWPRGLPPEAVVDGGGRLWLGHAWGGERMDPIALVIDPATGVRVDVPSPRDRNVVGVAIAPDAGGTGAALAIRTRDRDRPAEIRLLLVDAGGRVLRDEEIELPEHEGEPRLLALGGGIYAVGWVDTDASYRARGETRVVAVGSDPTLPATRLWEAAERPVLAVDGALLSEGHANNGNATYTLRDVPTFRTRWSAPVQSSQHAAHRWDRAGLVLVESFGVEAMEIASGARRFECSGVHVACALPGAPLAALERSGRVDAPAPDPFELLLPDGQRTLLRERARVAWIDDVFVLRAHEGRMSAELIASPGEHAWSVPCLEDRYARTIAARGCVVRWDVRALEVLAAP